MTIVRLLLRLAGLLLLAGGLAAQAAAPVAAPANPPVVVELFASQGCPNCPKAEALLAELATRDDLIALSFAVDYWDYLGWRDTFATPAFTARQYAYGRNLHKPRVYTPQMVLNGRSILHGVRGKKLSKALAKAARQSTVKAPRLQARLNDKGMLVLDIEGPAMEGASIWMAAYTPGAQNVRVDGGENKGKTMLQVNVVSSLTRLANWRGGATHMVMPMPAEGGCAIFVQKDGQGPILAAVKVQA